MILNMISPISGGPYTYTSSASENDVGPMRYV